MNISQQIGAIAAQQNQPRAAISSATGKSLGARVATPKLANAGTSPASTSGASSSNSTTITANDFLTLLVAEMKNQDPTATQDPNAYINQLVGVNSLEQLISINQDLQPAASPSAVHRVAPAAGGGSAPVAAAGRPSNLPTVASAERVASSLAPVSVQTLHGAAGAGSALFDALPLR